MISPSDIGQLANKQHTLELTVTSFLGATSTSTITFQKVAAATVPSVSIVGAASQSFSLSDALRLASSVAKDSVCSGKYVGFSWSATNGWAGVPAGYSQPHLFVPSPKPAAAGDSHTIQLAAFFNDTPSVVATSSVTVTFSAAPLLAHLAGPSGDVLDSATIVLDASASSDPNDLTDALEPMRYTFECRQLDSLAPCFASTAMGTVSGAAWTIPGGLLSNDVWHVLRVTVAKGSGGSLRTASAQLELRPRAASGGVPTGLVVRRCAATSADCAAAVHNVGDDLSLSLVRAADSTSATAAWSSAEVALSGANTGTGGTTATDLVILASALPAAGSITVTATLTMGGVQGLATLRVPLNAAPACQLSSCVAVETLDATFANHKFRVTARGFWDADGEDSKLTYEFGEVVDGKRRTVAGGLTSTSYLLAGLGEGVSTLFTCAVDAYGARACATADVTVNVKPAGYDSLLAAEAISAEQCAASGDLATLLACSYQQTMLLADGGSSLSPASASTSTFDGTVPTLSYSTTSSALQTSVLSMLTKLSDAADGSDDPAVALQILAAMAAYAEMPGALSPAARLVMLQTARRAMDVLLVHSVPLTSSQLGDVCAVLGVTAVPVSTAALDVYQQFVVSMSVADDATLLAATNTAPGLPPLSAGHDFVGVHATVATQTPASLSGYVLAVGPSAASVSTALVGLPPVDVSIARLPTGFDAYCTSTPAACDADDGHVVRLRRYEYPSMFLGISADPSLGIPDGVIDVVVVSGTLALAASGRAADGSLCAAGAPDCSVQLTFAVTNFNNAKTTKCLRFVDDAFLEAVDLSLSSTHPNASDPSTGHVTCSSPRLGTFLVVQYVVPQPPPPSPPHPPPAPPPPYNTENTRYMSLIFDTDYAWLTETTDRLRAYKVDLRTEVTTAFSLPLNASSVLSVVPGSVVSQVMVVWPQGYTLEQIDEAVDDNAAYPIGMFSADFRAKYSVTNVQFTKQDGPNNVGGGTGAATPGPGSGPSPVAGSPPPAGSTGGSGSIANNSIVNKVIMIAAICGGVFVVLLAVGVALAMYKRSAAANATAPRVRPEPRDPRRPVPRPGGPKLAWQQDSGGGGGSGYPGQPRRSGRNNEASTSRAPPRTGGPGPVPYATSGAGLTASPPQPRTRAQYQQHQARPPPSQAAYAGGYSSWDQVPSYAYGGAAAPMPGQVGVPVMGDLVRAAAVAGRPLGRNRPDRQEPTLQRSDSGAAAYGAFPSWQQ